MRIVVVNNRHHVTGGPERYLFDVRTLLEERGHEVIPFAVRYAQNDPSEYERYFVPPPGGSDAVYLRDVKGPLAKARLFGRSVYSFESRRRLARLLEDVRPDVVYVIIAANYLSPSVLHACRDAGVPVVMRLSDFHLIAPCYLFFDGERVCERCLNGTRAHAVRKRCLQTSATVSLARVAGMAVHDRLRLYDTVARFVAPSEFLRTKMIEAGYAPERLVHIPSFIDPRAIESVPSAPVEADEVTFVYVGRLSPEKGVGRLLDAFELAGSPGSLEIIGSTDTPEASTLQERARSHGAASVRFLGQLDRAEILQRMRRARAVVVPSICYENLPLVALEAMLAGTAVVAHDLGSLPEVVSHEETGLLCGVEDPHAMAAALARLAADVSLARRLGTAGHARVLAENAPGAHISALLDLWAGILGRRGAAMSPHTAVATRRVA